jgi:predicted nucleotidyltransferase
MATEIQLKSIENELSNILQKLMERFSEGMRCLILYGSWAKGTAKEDSDIDMLVIFDQVDSDTWKVLYEIERTIESERGITLVPASIEDFQKEKNPLFTAVKREGKIPWGNTDFTINPEPPAVKYAEYFQKSREVETHKVEMAEKILKEHPDYGSAELCFVASKHAIQMALAMKGVGYSSKIAVLLPLVKEHLGKDVALKFKKLFDLYVKAEYGVEFLTQEEAKQAVICAREILKECYNEKVK